MNTPPVPNEINDFDALATLQRWFQAVVCHPGGVEAGLRSEPALSSLDVQPETLAAWILPSRQLSSQQRLAIYANAYFARLLECMRAVFPMLAVAAGDEAFTELALGYLLAYPSRSYTLCKLGGSFPRYLAESRPARDEALGSTPDWADLLIDLAELEWTINEVFDGPGSEQTAPLDPHDLANLGPRSDQVQVVTCPSLRLMTARFPLHGYYTRLKAAELSADDDAPDDVSPPAAGVSHLALLRREFVVWRYPLTAAQHALLAELQNGAELGPALATATELLPAALDQEALQTVLAGWFRGWTAAGFFKAVMG